MAVMYPENLRQWVRQAEELEYFFAISCFNVSPVPGAKPASREQRKHFLRLCFGSPYSAATVLNELFVALVERLHRIWTEMRCREIQSKGAGNVSSALDLLVWPLAR